MSPLAGKTSDADFVFRSSDNGLLTYIGTRLRSRLVRRLTPGDYGRFVGMSLDQIVHALSESAYVQEAKSLAMQYSGDRLIREMVKTKVASETAGLRSMCKVSATASNWVRAYSWKYDLRRLRFALRARRVGGDVPEGFLSPLANLSHEVYEKLATLKGADKEDPAYKALMDTPFAETMKKILSDAPPSPDEAEVALLHDFYCGTVSKLLEASPRNDPVVGLLNHEVDYINLLSLLSGKLSGESHEQLLAQLIPSKMWQREDKVRELIETKDMAALSAALRKFSKAGVFGALPEKGKVTSSDIERAALKALLREALKAMRSGVPTPASIIGYFACIEIEAFNLWAYVSAFAADVPKETVETMLVHEGKVS